MKTKFIIVAILSFCVFSQLIKAELLQDELAMKTDVGEVVITIKQCDETNTKGFEYAAYATEGAQRHEGCWFKDHDIVNIWFYAEHLPLVATYKDYYFKPRNMQ